MTKLAIFAQPMEFEPALKVEREIFPSYVPADEGKVVHLTDIGRNAWMSAKKLHPKMTLRLDSYDPSGYEWAMTMYAPSLAIAVKCMEPGKKKVLFPGIRNIRNYVIHLEFTGGYYTIVKYVKKLVADMGRRPYDIADWQNFLEMFGVSKPDVEKQWSNLLATDISSDVRRLYVEVENELREAQGEGLDIVQQAKSLMLQSESAIEEEDFDLAINILETARGMVKDARAMGRQINVRKEMAADMISFVQTIIIKASRSGLDTTKAQKLLTEGAQALMERADWELATNKAMQARSIVELDTHKQEQAVAALETTMNMILDVKRLGSNVAQLMQLQEKGEAALKYQDFTVVLKYAGTIRNQVTKIKSEYQQMLDQKEQAVYSLATANTVIDEAKGAGCNMSTYEATITEARALLRKNQFDKVIEMAEGVRKASEENMRAFAEASEVIQLASSMLNDARNFIETVKIEQYLAKARDAVEKNDYVGAVNTATMCKDMIEVALVDGEPKIEVEIKSKDLKPSMWNRSIIEVHNKGTAHAKNISLKFLGQVEATRLQKILFIRGGEKTELEVGLKPNGAGEVAYDVETMSSRAYDGVGYSSKAHKWLRVSTGAPSEAAPGPEETEAEGKEKTLVEEIYVVYHDGRLIFHESCKQQEEVDDMILSSMLTAVQRFIKDSFKTEDGGLGKLEFGRLKLILEHGQVIYIALVLSGRIPAGLKEAMSKVVSEIENKHFDKLTLWDGNMTELEDTHDLIRTLYDVSKMKR